VRDLAGSTTRFGSIPEKLRTTGKSEPRPWPFPRFRCQTDVEELR
jgi:hypothetical protein